MSNFQNLLEKRICRLCLTEGDNLLPIFRRKEFETDAVTMDMKITICTTVKVSVNDHLSKSICLKCFDSVSNSFAFRRQCIKSDSILKSAMMGKKELLINSFIKPSAVESDIPADENSHPPKPVQKEKKKPNRSPFSKYCCDSIFLTRRCYRQHKIKYHPDPNTYTCDHCGKSGFTSNDTLKRHKLLHTGRFSCRTCGKNFICQAILRTHERDKHENDRPFVCDHCGKTYVTELLLKYHQRFHTGERKYVCETCGTAFVTSSSLTKHRRLHLDDRPFICDTCGKGFIERRRLVEHIRVHTGERPYICGICCKAFAASDKLSKHLRSHVTESEPEMTETVTETYYIDVV